MIAQSPNMMINTLGIYQHYRTDWCHRFRIFWNAVATCMVQYKIRLLRSTYMWVIFVHQRHIHAHARKWSNQICSNTIEYQYNSILYMFTTYIYIYVHVTYCKCICGRCQVYQFSWLPWMDKTCIISVPD